MSAHINIFINEVGKRLQQSWIIYPPAWIICSWNPLNLMIFDDFKYNIRFHTSSTSTRMHFHNDRVELIAINWKGICYSDVKYCDPDCFDKIIRWFKYACWVELISYCGLLFLLLFLMGLLFNIASIVFIDDQQKFIYYNSIGMYFWLSYVMCVIRCKIF